MRLAHKPYKVKLIVGLIAKDVRIFESAKRILERRLKNSVDFESDCLAFDHTEYYKEEFGQDLKRRFLSFEKAVSLADIYRVKIMTNRIEDTLSKSGKRRINIDPGYLDLSKLVLFSTKDYIHRIYMKRGIYAEVTLFYKDGSFNPWPWTYPDYKTPAYINIFNSIRGLYKKPH